MKSRRYRRGKQSVSTGVREAWEPPRFLTDATRAIRMRTIRSLGLAGVGLALFAGGCGAQAGADLVVSSDPVLRELAAALLPDLAERSGMELRGPVRLETRSREELVRYLKAKLDEKLPQDEADARVDAYALLGLVPPELDLRAVLLELYTEQVAGFYEPESATLFVLDDQPAEAVRALLVHELVHAIQDQNTDLNALTDSSLGNDRATAAQAAIEGHATLVMLEYMTEQMTGAPVDLGEIPDFAAQLRPALEAMTSQFPALASAPRIIRESLLFPYVEGAGFVQGLWSHGERVAPFGDALPESTEQILRKGDGAPPIELELSVEGASIALEDVLGRFELGILLQEVVGANRGWLADGWDGDRYALVEEPDGTRSLVSFVIWERSEQRDRFADAVVSSASRFGGEVEMERVQIAGRPATVLKIGVGDGVTVSATEIRRR